MAAPPPRLVTCQKLGKELPGMPYKPFDNDLGQKIYDNISMDAWRLWLEHSKMLINEYRLDLTSESGQRLWMTECEKYFFGEGSDVPAEFVPENK